jgi:hypothetical protein
MSALPVLFPFREEIEEDNVIKLGAYPASDGTDDWLSKLPIGTEFLSQASFVSYELDEYEIVEKSKWCVKLLRGNNTDNQGWVISKKFSEDNRLVEILHYGRSDQD